MADFIVRKLQPGQPRSGICGPCRVVADSVEYNLAEDEQLVAEDAVNLRLESMSFRNAQKWPLIIEPVVVDPNSMPTEGVQPSGMQPAKNTELRAVLDWMLGPDYPKEDGA